MKRLHCTLALFAFLAIDGFLVVAAASGPVTQRLALNAGPHQTAVFAGGCFWGVDAVFKHVKGVSQVVSGYSGGNASTAEYEVVSSGTTGHAESVEVTYDLSQVSYSDLLKVFFYAAHDPTELNRQGPDSGSQYRSAIFYTNAIRKRSLMRTSLDSIKKRYSPSQSSPRWFRSKVFFRPKDTIRTFSLAIPTTLTSSSTTCPSSICSTKSFPSCTIRK